MRIKIVQQSNGSWMVTPLGGIFQGKEIASVDGIVLNGVSFEGSDICGTPQSVWGMVVHEDLIFNDPVTIKGLGVGRSFNTMAPNPIERHKNVFRLTVTHERMLRAKSLWILNGVMQVYGEETGAVCGRHELECGFV